MKMNHSFSTSGCCGKTMVYTNDNQYVKKHCYLTFTIILFIRLRVS